MPNIIVSKVDVTTKHPPECYEGLFTVVYSTQCFEDVGLHEVLQGCYHWLERGEHVLGLGTTERGSVKVLTSRGIKFVHPKALLERTQRES